MRYFIIAGEASGDLHGSNLMKALKVKDRDADFCFFGGELMELQGGVMLKHYRDMAFMGAIDVLRNIGKIGANFKLAKKKLIDYQPDVLILIDYPGFNLKMAEYARKYRIPVFYYILPKVWAWKEWRIKKLRSCVDEFFSILPFEEEYFRRHGLPVHYTGSPLVDAVAAAEENFGNREEFLERNGLPDRPLVALLPGSRIQEIKLMLPLMTRIAKDFPWFSFVISGTGAFDQSLYDEYSEDRTIPVLWGQTYEMLHFAHAALVTSGTATLEAALLNVPQVVLYKMAGGKVGYKIFRFLFLKVEFVSLPNLILGREAVREFVMHEMKDELVRPETELLLNDRGYRGKIFQDYGRLKEKMGEKGASERTAKLIFENLKMR